MKQSHSKTDPFQYWARSQFNKFKSCVAFIESTDVDGDKGIGSCFHVGEGVFVTARHVVEGREINVVGFDDHFVNQQLLQEPEHWGKKPHGRVSIIDGPYFHSNPNIDVACFRVEPFPTAYIPLGVHLDDWLGQYELVLHRTLVLGYPPIPFSDRPVLVASVGEVNALIDMYTGGHPHFVVSTMARGGFSGGPALVAYNEHNLDGGTAVLGLVTKSLTRDSVASEQGYMAVLTVEPIYTCLEVHGMLPENR